MVVAMDEAAVYGSPMYTVIDNAMNAGVPPTDDSEDDCVDNDNAEITVEQTGTPSPCRKKHSTTLLWHREKQMDICPIYVWPTPNLHP